MTAGNILRVVSTKGVVIGALTYLIASWVLGFVLLAAAMNAANQGTDNIGGSAVGTALYLASISGPHLIAGYVAAAAAGRHELINGTLVGVLCALALLLLDLAAGSEWQPVDRVYLVTLAPVPVLSFIGACLYLVFGWPRRG